MASQMSTDERRVLDDLAPFAAKEVLAFGDGVAPAVVLGDVRGAPARGPLTARDGNAAPAYYRKAILESGEEWSQHRKLHEMKNGSVRGTVPPGFSYFAVGFGVHAGYATVIEDTDEWPADFGRDVLEGLSLIHISEPTRPY